MDALGAVTGCAPDSPLGNSVWRMFDSYTAAVGQLAGDEGDWLCWFIYENDCGKKAGEVTKGKGKPRKIKTLGDLLWCIKP
jgi:hypothetical protein